MAVVAQDYVNGALQFLSGVNVAVLLGAGNSTFSGNATITLVQDAVRALAQVAGGSPDLVEKVCRSLREGVNAGVVAETHTFTTVAGARAAITGLTGIPEVSSTYTGNLNQ